MIFSLKPYTHSNSGKKRNELLRWTTLTVVLLKIIVKPFRNRHLSSCMFTMKSIAQWNHIPVSGCYPSWVCLVTHLPPFIHVLSHIRSKRSVFGSWFPLFQPCSVHAIYGGILALESSPNRASLASQSRWMQGWVRGSCVSFTAHKGCICSYM